MKLSQLNIGETAFIVEVNGTEEFIHRLSEIGFVKGEQIKVRKIAPLFDPMEFEIMNTNISLRKKEASNIIVCKEISETLSNVALEVDNNNESVVAIHEITHVVISAESDDMQTESSVSTLPAQQSQENIITTEKDEKISSDEKTPETSQVKICQCQCGSGGGGNLEKCNDNSSCDSCECENNKINPTLDDQIIMDIEDAYNTSAACKNCPSKANCIQRFRKRMKWNGEKIHVALLGNPNCGKTTFFNRCTGGNEKEGNYCGVTVDVKKGTFIHNDVKVYLMDLPGVYSLTSYTPEEKYVEDYLKRFKPDVILNIIDANNLPRNLFLTSQLVHLGIPIVGALNMYDELEKNGISIETEKLSEELNIKFLPVVSRRGKGIKEVFDVILETKGKTPEYPKDIMDLDTTDAKKNYQYITKILKDVYIKNRNKSIDWEERIDRVVTNRFLSFPILIIFVYLIFMATFKLGDYPMTWIDELVSWISDSLSESISGDSAWKELLINGIIAGVGGVIIFLPNILILYLILSWFEDCGYMARAVFILDRLMCALGLHGKSFIPLITGFGCNVPAIMATRTIEDRKSRLITILVLPLMSCSARLPVFVLLAGAFFKRNSGLIVTSLYLIGVFLAIIIAKILQLFVGKGEMNKGNSGFIMELPPYRLPTIRNTLKHTWEKGKQYLRKMGTIILIASIVIWALGYFPNHDTYPDNPEMQMEKSYIGYIGKFVEPVFKPMGSNWKMDVGLISGLGAKEVVVSTLGVLYSGEEIDTEDDEQTSVLAEKIAKDITPAAGIAYMLFVLIYFPCVATIAAVKHETNSWKWASFVVVYTMVLAWVLATVVYQIGSLF